jgi:capsular exopolysaccharide synthesis family protein
MNNMAPMIRGSFTPASGSGPDARGVEQDQIPLLRQYLRIVMRWRWVIGGAMAACLLIGLVATFLMTPRYTATTTVEIARETKSIADVDGNERDASVTDQEFYQTQYGLLQSRSLAERVAGQLRLADDPAFFEMFDVTSKRPEFRVTNGRFPAGGRPVRLRAAGQILLDNVNIAPTRLSRLVDIRVISPDPAFSAKVANAWSANFIQSTLERRFQATSYARKFLEGRLAQLRGRLEDSERQLVRYASDQRIINLPAGQSGDGERTVERSLVADDLSALNTALAQATADRVQAESRLEAAGNGPTTEGLRNSAINGLRQRRAELAAEYQRLMTQFEPGYPTARAVASQLKQLDASIAREEGRVSSSVAADYREAVGRQQGLQTRVDTLKSDLLDLRRRSIQYNIIQREVDTNRQLYDGLLQRYKEIGVAGGVGVNNVSIVDPADLPERPSSPRLGLNLLLSLLAGVALGSILAFALEQADEAITEPGEIERLLGLPLLGSVPKTIGREPKEALLDRKSELVDAYLAIQTNLEFTTEHGLPRTLAVTSTRPAEGKSTTALALATMLARAQRKVILVDGDMRSPSVHQLAGVSHDHGLSNFLAGSDDIAPLLFHMDQFGFTGMSAGPIPPNAAELLTGHRLPLLLSRLLESYDHVVIDSPPVMGLADAPLIASRVEAVVYAVESQGIRSSLVKTALARLRSGNARVVGGILTKFEARKAHFGYGYEYGYGYGREDDGGTRSSRR